MLDGDRSWQNLIALAGLGSLALLLIVSLFTVRELLGLWHRLLTEQGRVAVLEASAMMLRLRRSLGSRTGAAPTSGSARRRRWGSPFELDRLTLEITEHAALTEYDEINASLLRQRERGVHVAVDDTGAGLRHCGHPARPRARRDHHGRGR